MTSCDAEGAPGTGATLSAHGQPPHPPVMRVVSPFHTLASRRDPGLFTGKAFVFLTLTAPAGARLMHRDGSRQEHRALPPAPALCGVSWASQGWDIPASPAQFCREALDKVNLAVFRGSLLLWMGLKCPELNPHTPAPL